MIIQELPKMSSTATNGKSQLASPLGVDLASTTKREFQALVDPTCASWLLDNMHPRQRALSRPEVARFEQLLESKKFVELMHPGIWCNIAGQVCNARHRLTAQVNKQATLKWYLRLGCADDEIAALDQTRTRRHHQSINLTLEGVTAPMTSREEAALRVYRRLIHGEDHMLAGDSRVSVEEILEMRERAGQDMAWSIHALPAKAGPASMVGVVAFARAINPGAVAAFVATYVDARLALGKIVTNKNAPGLSLARWVNTGGGRAGGTYTQTVVAKTLSAIRAHLEGRDLSKIYGDDDRAKPLRWFKQQLGI